MEKNLEGDTLAIVMNESEFYTLKEKVESIEKDTSRIWEKIDGNAREGLVDRTTRIEESIKNVIKSIGINSESLNQLKGSVDTAITGINQTNQSIGSLNNNINSHINDKNVHSIPGLIRGASGKIIIGLLAAGLVFNLLVDILVPPNVSVWDLISKWLGF